jgi:hypothetical protein
MRLLFKKARERLHCVGNRLLNLRQDIFVKIDTFKVFKYLSEILIRNLVSSLELPVICTFLLYSVISEMNISIFKVVNIVFATARAEVAFTEEITPEFSCVVWSI